MKSKMILIALVTHFCVKLLDSKNACFSLLLSYTRICLIFRQNYFFPRNTIFPKLFKTTSSKFDATISKSTFVFRGNLEFVFFELFVPYPMPHKSKFFEKSCFWKSRIWLWKKALDWELAPFRLLLTMPLCFLSE